MHVNRMQSKEPLQTLVQAKQLQPPHIYAHCTIYYTLCMHARARFEHPPNSPFNFHVVMLCVYNTTLCVLQCIMYNHDPQCIIIVELNTHYAMNTLPSLDCVINTWASPSHKLGACHLAVDINKPSPESKLHINQLELLSEDARIFTTSEEDLLRIWTLPVNYYWVNCEYSFKLRTSAQQGDKKRINLEYIKHPGEMSNFSFLYSYGCKLVKMGRWRSSSCIRPRAWLIWVLL